MENILPWGRRRRLFTGLAMAVLAIVVATTLVLMAAGPWWFGLVFVLAWMSAMALLQARDRT